jgi:hypothetical protein
MRRRLHGIVSLLLVCCAIALAVWVTFHHSLAWGLFSVGAIAVGFVAVLFAACTKCPCRHACAHVFVGRLTRFLPKRIPAPYTTAELLVVLASLAVIVLPPQRWLWEHRSLFAIYWALFAIAGLQIHLRVCRGCGNTLCPKRRPA